ncbi:helix-turn-helix domain-containing protein [Paenibacillus ehimensis]|uniref:Helix-turn-helix transcriptional regulator n=1 Tax=Paenibacillus ehimensis TaxID=79264 RepID=A0ABT8VFK3_9BACL|nr:helix-turn-helix transcriptional regulator [Paenibacillus ehimensis]MDO3679734.1 helix-turn-helix transcriptional regulator [Paenibacillus ehimensis]
MSNLKVIIGEKIRDQRKIKGMTQKELSKKANVQHTYLGDVERGARNISLESLEKIMEALDIEPSDLFDFKTIKINDSSAEFDLVLNEHIEFLRTKQIEDVKMINRITKDIFRSIEMKRN